MHVCVCEKVSVEGTGYEEKNSEGTRIVFIYIIRKAFNIEEAFYSLEQIWLQLSKNLKNLTVRGASSEGRSKLPGLLGSHFRDVSVCLYMCVHV